jgi:hypothetical protein
MSSPNIGILQETIKEESKETIKEEIKETIKEESKETIKEESKETIKEEIKETIKEEIKEEIKETIKEEIKETIKEDIKEETKNKPNYTFVDKISLIYINNDSPLLTSIASPTPEPTPLFIPVSNQSMAAFASTIQTNSTNPSISPKAKIALDYIRTYLPVRIKDIKTLDVQNVVIISINIIEEIYVKYNLTSTDKKVLALIVANEIIDNLSITTEEKIQWKGYVKIGADSSDLIIDLAISISKNPTVIKIEKKTSSWFSSLCSCSSKK